MCIYNNWNQTELLISNARHKQEFEGVNVTSFDSQGQSIYTAHIYIQYSKE